MLARFVGGAIIALCALMYFVSLVSHLLKYDLEKFVAELIMFILLGTIAILCFSF